MGRPLLTLKWSKTGNYPVSVDAWSSQPLAVLPAGTWFTPKTKPAAEDFNWLFGSAADDLTAAVDMAGAGLNWKPLLGRPPGNDQLGSAAREQWQTATWCSQGNARIVRWLAGARTSASNALEVMLSYDGGYTWAALGDAINMTGRMTSILADTGNPDITIAGVFTSASNEGRFYRLDLGGGTAWTNVQAFASANAKFSELRVFNSLIVGLFSGAALYTSADHGATWTSRTIPASGGLTTAADWAVAQSTTKIIAVQRVANKNTFMYSTDGTTWTASTAIGTVSATETPQDITYGTSATGGMFMLSIYDSGLGATRFMKSTDDGATWSSVVIGGTHTHINAKLSGLCSFGTLWCACSEETGHASFGFVSTNDGQDWRRTSLYLSDGVASSDAGYQRPRIWASPTGLVAANTKCLVPSFENGLRDIDLGEYYP